MDFRDRRSLRQCAQNALAGANYDPKKLMLIYAGVSLAATLIFMCIHYLLDNMIAKTGGLGGIGQRSLLSTLQMCLQLALQVVLPVWQFGLIAVTLRLVRGQNVTPPTLLVGFYNFWPVIRLVLLQGLLVFGIAMAASYLGTMVFLFTPWASGIMEAMSSAQELTEELMTAVMMESMLPLSVCTLLAIVALVVPYLYKLRLAFYLLLDSQEHRALQAIRISRGLMRGKRMALFKLDISFWWSYLLDGLALGVCFGDVVLTAVGVTLPIPFTVSAILFTVLGCALQLGLYYWKGMEVQTTYAAFYQAVIQPPLVPNHEA